MQKIYYISLKDWLTHIDYNFGPNPYDDQGSIYRKLKDDAHEYLHSKEVFPFKSKHIQFVDGVQYIILSHAMNQIDKCRPIIRDGGGDHQRFDNHVVRVKNALSHYRVALDPKPKIN